MDVLQKVAGKPGWLTRRVVATLFVAIASCGVAFSQSQRTGGPTPSAPGAEVYFIDLKDGTTVPAKLKIYFGLRNMGVAPAGSDRENSGHHHLLIDTELPPLDQPIPNDFNHLHFGAGLRAEGSTTRTLMRGDMTGGVCGMWSLSPMSSCKVCAPGFSVISVSVCPAPK